MVQQFDINCRCHELQFHGLLSWNLQPVRNQHHQPLHPTAPTCWSFSQRLSYCDHINARYASQLHRRLSYPELVGNRWLRTLCLSMVQQFDIISGCYRLPFHGLLSWNLQPVSNQHHTRCTNSSNSRVLTLAAPLIIISTTDVQLNCTGGCPILNSTVIDGSGPFAYQWYNNSILIPGATNSNFTACYPGTYNLSVTNTTSRCTNSSNLLVISPRDYPIVTHINARYASQLHRRLSCPELVGNRWLRTLCLSMVQQFDIRCRVPRLQFHGLLSWNLQPVRNQTSPAAAPTAPTC